MLIMLFNTVLKFRSAWIAQLSELEVTKNCRALVFTPFHNEPLTLTGSVVQRTLSAKIERTRTFRDMSGIFVRSHVPYYHCQTGHVPPFIRSSGTIIICPPVRAKPQNFFFQYAASLFPN